jgi:hypothetical protein
VLIASSGGCEAAAHIFVTRFPATGSLMRWRRATPLASLQLPYTRARMMAGLRATMPDHIFLYVGAAITLVVIILALLTRQR